MIINSNFFAFSPMIPSGIFPPFGLHLVRDYPLKSQCTYHRFLRAGRCENTAIMAQISHDQHIPGVIYTTACDQMRHLHDLMNEKGFLFNVPTTCGKQATKLYLFELERLVHHLAQFTHKSPSETDFEDAFNLWHNTVFTRPSIPQNRSHLLLLGSPIFSSQFTPLRQVMAPFNLLNYSETGHIFAKKIKNIKGSILEKYAQFYGSGNGFLSPFRRPNDNFYNHLKEFILKYNIQGIILNHTSWCDQWQGIATRLREILNIPQLVVVIDPIEAINTQRGLMTRLEAFKEQIQGGL